MDEYNYIVCTSSYEGYDLQYFKTKDEAINNLKEIGKYEDNVILAKIIPTKITRETIIEVKINE